MGIFGSLDLIPGINVGNAWTQFATGQDTDIFDGLSGQGGVRTTNSWSGVGPTNTNYRPPTDQFGRVQSANILVPEGNVGDGGTTTSGSGGGYAAPSYDPNVLSQFDQSEGLLNSGLGRLDGQLAIGRENVLGQYNNSVRDQDTQKTNANTSYKTSSTQNSQNLRTNKNTISDQASNGLRGLMRMLGAYGSVGSDMGVAGRAVADQASQQRSGAGQTFSANQSDLDTNWGNFQNAWNSQRQGLDNWKQNQINSVEAQGLSTKQSLLSKLAEIKAQRAAFMGGDPTAAAQPFLDQATALNGQIDSLGRQVQGYAGTAPSYEAKPLSSYDAGAGTSAQFVNNGQGGGGMSPYLSLLLGKDKKQPFNV